MGYHKAAHHRGRHQIRARQCVAAARLNPDYRCPRCGLTEAQGIERWGKTRGRFEAGHVNAGQIDGPLRAEHAHCNRSHGATLGNRRRKQRFSWP